jgi:hypothetical protein
VSRTNGTKWHWLATFEKVFISDPQAQQRLRTLSPNGLVQPATARGADMAQSGTGWQHFRRPSSPISKPRNALGPYRQTCWYSRRRRRRGRSAPASLSGASPIADRCAGWHKMAQDGTLLGGLECHLPRPGGDPERGSSGMVGTEVARAQTTNMPSFVSVDSACLQLTSGPGSRVSDRPSDRATHGSTGPSPGDGSVSRHTQAGWWDTRCAPPSALSSYLLQCCVLQIS